MQPIPRPRLVAQVEHALIRSPVVAIQGPRQCGKTTLARMVAASRESTYLDLEDPNDAARLQNPMVALGHLTGLVVLDEAQRHPGVAPALRVLVDRPHDRTRFLILGSASPELVRGASESLAGRVAFVDMGGFDLGEVGPTEWRSLWLRGRFPRSYLSETDADSVLWRRDFARTFIERDLPQYGVRASPIMLRRLWSMLAHCHGQTANLADIGRSLGESHTTVKRHVDILTAGMVLRQLQPWHESIAKRQVRSPKVYIRDSGLLHTLLELAKDVTIEGHPRLWASWEGFCVEEIVGQLGERSVWFWGTHGQAELDVLALHGGRRLGFEIKYADAPRITRSLHIAREDLRLDRAYVIYPGSGMPFPLADWVEAVPIEALPAVLQGLTGQA